MEGLLVWPSSSNESSTILVDPFMWTKVPNRLVPELIGRLITGEFSYRITGRLFKKLTIVVRVAEGEFHAERPLASGIAGMESWELKGHRDIR